MVIIKKSTFTTAKYKKRLRSNVVDSFFVKHFLDLHWLRIEFSAIICGSKIQVLLFHCSCSFKSQGFKLTTSLI